MSAVAPLRGHDDDPRRRRTTVGARRPQQPLARREQTRREHGGREQPRRDQARSLRLPVGSTLQRASALLPKSARESVPGVGRSERPLARLSTPVERAIVRRPETTLRLIEAARPRRRVALVAVAMCVVVFCMFIGAVAFQTQLASNQLSIDTTERAVRDARERYDVLRRQRAQLRSPNRLAIEAEALGMVPAETGEMITVDPAVVAAVTAAAADLPDRVSNRKGSLEQFGEVKSVTGDVP